MSRLEVDVKSIQKLIWSRALKARKTLTQFEEQAEKFMKQVVQQGLKSRNEGRRQVEKLVRDVKNLKKSSLYNTACQAKDELEKRVANVQERVFKLLNVPTKEELEKLNRKVDSLSRQFNKKERVSK